MPGKPVSVGEGNSRTRLLAKHSELSNTGLTSASGDTSVTGEVDDHLYKYSPDHWTTLAAAGPEYFQTVVRAVFGY